MYLPAILFLNLKDNPELEYASWSGAGPKKQREQEMSRRGEIEISFISWLNGVENTQRTAAFLQKNWKEKGESADRIN